MTRSFGRACGTFATAVLLVLVPIIGQTALCARGALGAQRTSAVSDARDAGVHQPRKQSSSDARRVMRELPERRTRSGRLYAMDDGTVRAQYSGSLVNYRRPDGSLAPIDASLEESSSEGREVSVNRANEFRVELPRRLTDDWVSLETSAVSVALRPARRGLGEATILTGGGLARSESATERAYTDVFEGATVEYESRADGLKETIVVPAPTSQTAFGFDLRVTGGTAVLLSDGSIGVRRKGETSSSLVMPAPCMWDSAQTTTGPSFSSDVRYSLSGRGPEYHLSVVPSSRWMADPARVWPVTIDPGVLTVRGQPADTFVSSAYPSTNFSAHTLVWVNTNDPAANWTEYGLVQPGADLLGDMEWMADNGWEAISATLNLRVAQVARGGSVTANACDSDADVSTVTWQDRPGTDPDVTGATASAAVAGAWTRLDISAILGSWQEQGLVGGTIRLAGSPGTHVGFDSAERVTEPMFTVDYAGRPEVEVSSPAEGAMVSGVPSTQWSYMDDLTGNPQVAATIELLDGQSGDVLARSQASASATSSAIPAPPEGWKAGVSYVVAVRVASEPIVGRKVWSDPAEVGFEIALPEPVTEVSVETTASDLRFVERDDDGDGSNDRSNDANDSGRGSVQLSWEPVDDAKGYDVYLSDGCAYRKVGSTVATSWSSAGKGLYPSDSGINGMPKGSSQNAFLTGAGLDLRDDPRPLYARTAGTPLDGAAAYSFRIVARNENGSRPATESAEVLVSLANRTEQVTGPLAHTDYSLGDLFGDEGALRLDTGALLLQTTDLTLPSLGPDARIERVYSSSDRKQGRLGAGWHFNFDARVSVDTTGVTFVDETGEETRFLAAGDGWVGRDGRTDRLAGSSAGGFSLTRKDRSVLRFDSAGRLISETDRNGHTVGYEWGNGSLVMKAPNDVWLVHERRIVVAFDASGQIERAVLKTPDGERTVEYEASDTQVSVICLPGTDAQKTRIYRYQGGRVSAIAVPGFAPSASGEAVWRIDYGSGDTSISVSNETGAGTSRMPLGATWNQASRTALLTSATSTRTIAWDVTGAEVMRTDENTSAAVRYAYDVAGNPIETIEPNGAITRSVYDSRGNVVVAKDAAGAITKRRYAQDLCVVEHDARGSEITREYDANGNLLVERRLLDESGGTAVTTYRYASGADSGALISQTVKTGADVDQVTEYSDYSDCGEPQRVTNKGVRLEYGGPLRDLTSTNGYDSFGNSGYSQDSLGRTIARTQFDAAGRPIRTTDASDTATEYTYGVLGGLESSRRSNPATSACADWSTKVYNGAGLLAVETARASDGTTASVTRYAYDEAGRRILADDNTVPGVERTVYDAQGNVSQEWDEASSGSQESATRSTYGPSGELLAQAAPGSKVATDVTTYDSAGQPIAERPTVGPATRYGYNAAGDLLLVESPTEAGANVTTMSVDLGGRTVLSSSSGQAPVRTTYDLAGETLSTRVGDLGPTREFRNSLGWSLRTVEPDGFETRRTYDQLGHAVAEQVVGGYSSAASFDACGRAVSRINADGTRLAIVYDVFGRPIRERHTSSAGQQLANIVTDYDRAGRVLSESDTLAGWRRDRFYDSSGTVTTIESRRTGTVLTRTQVEASGVLRSAEATIAGVRVDLSTTATDTAGRVTDISSRSLPGDRRVTFDDAGRLLRTGLRSGSDATATGVATYEYSSIDGRKNAEAASFKLRGTESSSFRYSGAGRLSSVNTNGLTSTFAYTDATGALRQYRRGKEASVTILTDYLGRPTSAGSSAYGWDSLGRRISSYVVGDGWTTYGWTGDRLSTASSLLRMSASYLYDANGQRLRSAVTSGGVTTTTNWEYDGLRLLGYTAAASTGATWSVDFVYDPDGKPFGAVYRASDALPIAFSFRTTARGDVRELLDAGGNAFGHYSYDAYGVPVEVVSAPTSRVPASLATRVVARQPLRYAGYVWDPETRLYYLSERYYDPRIASFLSRDPLRTAEDGSSFQYCGGDPVGRTDPEGTMFLSLQDRTRYNRIRRKLVAAARQLVSLKIKYGNGQQRAAAGGRMDCSGAVGWILRQADPWFARRIPSPASHERWNTDSFVAKLGWRTRYHGVGSFTAGRPWRIGDVVVKGWSGAKMGHIAIVVREGKRPQVFECAASKREGYKPGARILPLSSVSYWRPVYVGRLFGYEPNAPYGGKR